MNASYSFPVSADLVSKYERGKRKPSAEYLACFALCVELDSTEVIALVELQILENLITFEKDVTSEILRRINGK